MRGKADRSDVSIHTGTLGIVTEATLRLAPLLPNRVAVCSFPGVSEAVSAVTDIINGGVPVQCAELCDSLAIRAINQAGVSNTSYLGSIIFQG